MCGPGGSGGMHVNEGRGTLLSKARGLGLARMQPGGGSWGKLDVLDA